MIRWLGTITYLISMVLTSLNIYPINLVFGAIGAILWCLAGLQYRDNALIVGEVASSAIYIFGLIAWSLK
jgi:hypothetical protein